MEFAMSCTCAAASAACFYLASARFRQRRRILASGGFKTEAPPLQRMSLFVSKGWNSARGRPRLIAVSSTFGATWFGFCLPALMPFSAVAGAAAGALLPGALVRMWARRRREGIERSLPGALDWLALSVEAGEGFSQAIVRITGHLKPGPLREEFGLLCADIRTGSSRRSAFSAMARRANSQDLSSVVSLLIQADALGTGVGPVLRLFSRRLRAKRLSRAERRGVAAAQKALLPLIFCIMPATFVVVFGPLVVRLAVGGIEAFF